MDGRKVPLKMSVEYISFSAHVDFTQNSQFIDEVKAPHVVSYPGSLSGKKQVITFLPLDPCTR